jgi:hypothetical protein
LKQFLLALILFQTPTTSAISGKLVQWGTTEPVVGATIELRSAAGTAVAITASQGTGDFVFARLPAGSYRIVAMANGFATAEYGQLRPSGDGRTLTVESGKDYRIRVEVPRGGVISGRVTNEDGQPMAFARVEIMKVAYDAEGRVVPSTVLKVLTDDLGQYRAFWLAPGRYVVNAGRAQLNLFGTYSIEDPRGSDKTIPTTMISSNTRTRASAAPLSDSSPASRLNSVNTLYYPYTPDASSAEVIDVRAGAETPNINIQFSVSSSPTNAVWLRGVVLEPGGAPTQAAFGISISTWPVATPTLPASVRMMTTRVPAGPGFVAGAERYVADNGKFDGAATRGVYQIRATRGDLSGRRIVDVGSKDLDVAIPLFPPTIVTGRVQLEGATANLNTLRVTLRTTPNVQFNAPVAADGQFRVEGVVPGDYQVSVLSLQDAYVKSMRAGNTDLAEGLLKVDGGEAVPPVEISLNLAATSIKGRVVNARGEAVAQATVVALPPGAPPYRSDRYAVITTNASGQFEFRGLPPGGYRLFSWEDVDAGTWFNVSYMATREREAVSLTLAERDVKEGVELRAIPAGN